jgi:hypothetical protein
MKWSKTMSRKEEIISGANIKLNMSKDGSIADSTAKNKAKVTVTQNGYVLNNWGLKFSITSGNAIFSGNGSQTYEARTKNGIAYAEFCDATAENGTIMVIETTNDSNQPITDGSSDSKSYQFISGDVPAYDLSMKKVVDNVAADGIQQDVASVIITDRNNNPPSGENLTVLFTSTSTTTAFDTSKSSVDPRSTKSMLYVVASPNANNEIEALAYFSDTVGESDIIITSSIPNSSLTVPQQANFGFNMEKWDLTIKQINNNSPADGYTRNSINVSISHNDESVSESQNPVIQIDLDNASVSFDLTNALPGSTKNRYLVKAAPSNNKKNNSVDVYFVSNTACIVNVKVSVPSIKALSPQSSPFTFIKDIVLNLNKETDNSVIGGELNYIGANIVTDSVEASNATKVICFYTNDNFVSFDLRPTEIDKGRSTKQQIYVNTYTHYDGYQYARAAFSSEIAGGVTIYSYIDDGLHRNKAKWMDFCFLYEDSNKFYFDNSIFKSTENVTVIRRLRDQYGKPIVNASCQFTIGSNNLNRYFVFDNNLDQIWINTDVNGVARANIRPLITGKDIETIVTIKDDQGSKSLPLLYHNTSPITLQINEPDNVNGIFTYELSRFPLNEPSFQVDLLIVDEYLDPDNDAYFVDNKLNNMTVTSNPFSVIRIQIASRKSKTVRFYASFYVGGVMQYRSVPVIFK